MKQLLILGIWKCTVTILEQVLPRSCRHVAGSWIPWWGDSARLPQLWIRNWPYGMANVYNPATVNQYQCPTRYCESARHSCLCRQNLQDRSYYHCCLFCILGFCACLDLNLNLIMSPLRVTIEWSYGKVKYTFKSLSFKMAQKMMLNQPVHDFINATFFANCRTCYQWDGPFRNTFGVAPPTIQDYLSQ